MAAGVVALAIFGCVYPPRSFRIVKRPGESRAMNNKVAVVYSKYYQINVGGLGCGLSAEQLKPRQCRTCDCALAVMSNPKGLKVFMRKWVNLDA